VRARRVWLVTLGAIGTGSLLYVFIARGLVSPGMKPAEGLGWPLFGSLPLFAFGIWLLTATSSRVALYVALGGTGSALGSAYETFVWTHLDVLHWSGFPLFNQIGLTADAITSIGFLLMIATFPNGVLERRWQRVAVSLVWLHLLVGPATLLTHPTVVMPEYIGIDGSSIPNPYVVPALEFLRPVVENVIEQWWVAPGLAVIVFYWRGLFSGPVLRARMRVMVIAVSFALGTYMLWETTIVAGIDNTPFGTATTIAVAASMIAVPVAGIHGILRYGAYDIAVADRGRVVIRLSTTLITILYVWAVATPALVLSDTLRTTTAVLITAAMAVVLLPVRGWLSRAIRRVVFGNRDEHLALLGDLGSRLEQAVDVDEVLARLAQGVREGLGASWVRISLASPQGRTVDVPNGVAGTVSGEPATGIDLTRGDRVIGRIDVGPPRNGTYSLAELGLLQTVARQATTAVANVRLTAELAEQLDELTASRARLITAQDAERRRIERDLHDGVQQSIVALVAGLRLARNRLDRGDLNRDELTELQAQAREILADLRELAHGIHPQVLVDSGLVAAVESRTARFPVPLTIDADDAVRARRLDPDVEAVAFYTIREALANVAKHAQATRARVTLAMAPAGLRIEVSDDGTGFAPAAAPGPAEQAGLANIRDRVAAIHGRYHLETEPGAGTSLVVELPLPAEPADVTEADALRGPDAEAAPDAVTDPDAATEPARA
jgi:signal transduction histidine kinase